jgi:hypothetical protein
LRLLLAFVVMGFVASLAAAVPAGSQTSLSSESSLPLQISPSRVADPCELSNACSGDDAGGQSSQDETQKAQSAQQKSAAQNGGSAQSAGQPSNQGTKQQTQPGQQPKRILGVMPNFRAVSAGTVPPPPTPKQSFMIATRNSFDYSAFVFVGITSFLAEATDAHPDLGKGVAGFGRYYWRGYLDKTDGNYLVIFALPTVFHQDERYYAKGKGPILKRGIYAASRILITPDYHGNASFNASELLGRAMAQAISISYYPSHDRTFGTLASKYAYALGRDALTNTFREFWPDIAVHVLHRHP